jgi:hypothetical protein
MIKKRKQELLSLLGTMGYMADLLPKLADPSGQIQDILAACQCIRENLEGETAPGSLGLLENIENSLKEGKLDILDSVKKLKSAFDSEAKANREALFLPYKASMWDSLESIYLAAKDDPDWDALVMPIPYYDKKDWKFTEMHWETNYPKNIPLIDYRKYNIEEQRPDIIFIHNPYDNCNIVTSVHPDFYSERLRNLTSCLVYVPYFVGNGLNVAEHFCTVSGCIFAHKVIVQTEDERKIYVKTYKEFAKRNKVPERFEQIGKKFLALGSPKLDKAITAKREDYEIPPEWEKLTSGRKVVFYNLSIGSLLEHTVENGRPSDKYFQKVRSVFEFFRKQSDAVLLWRPHPLLESTIKSMRPWLEREYAEIVSEYKSGGYGIYDDTEDLSRAITLSDVYYGDGSSVVELFEAAGKPVACQFLKYMPTIHGFWADENSLWFIDSNNILYKHNKQSNKTESAGIIPGQDAWGNLRIAENNGKLYFAPYHKNNKISIFDMAQKSFKQINFKNDGKFDSKFQSVISFKNFVYFVPYEFPAIMRLNTDTNEIEYFSEWVNEVSKLQISKLQEAWKNIFWNSCVVGQKIAMVIHGANAVMFFNMETGGYEIKHIGEKSEQYVDICFDGQNYYIAPVYKDYVVKWNRQTDKTSKIKFPSSFTRKTNKGGNFNMQYSNKHIWLFPYAANNAYKINTETDEITELLEFVEHFENKNIDWYYHIILANENFIYVSANGKGTVKYNTNTRELKLINDFDGEMMALLMIHKAEKSIVENKNAGKTIWEYFK